jgi:hypothetical protein
MANEIMTKTMVDSANLLKSVLSASSDFDEHFEEYEEAGVVTQCYTLGEFANGETIATKDPSTIAWIRAIKATEGIHERADIIRCCGLAQLRKMEAHKKAGLRSFGEFAQSAFPKYDSKTLGIYANIGEAFFIPTFAEDGMTVIDVIPRRRAFEGFSISALQTLLAVMNDERFGEQQIVEDVAEGILYPKMKQPEIKAYVTNLRGSSKKKDDKDEKDSNEGKSGKKGETKYNPETTATDTIITLIGNAVVDCTDYLETLRKRCEDGKLIYNDENTTKAFKGLATALNTYIKRIESLDYTVVEDEQEEQEEQE